MHGFAAHDSGSLNLHSALLGTDQFPAAVDWLTKRVDNASEHAVADWHRKDASGGLDSLALFDLVDIAEYDGADRLLVKVQRKADGAIFEFEQFVHCCVRQPADAGDAIANSSDSAHGAGLVRGLKAFEV